MYKIFKYVIRDILRNRIMLAYTALLLLASGSIFSLEDTSAKAILSVLNIVLLIVPLVSIVFATIYVYNSNEFIELLLSQPIQRKKIWLSIFYGLSLSLGLAFLVGIGIPVLLFERSLTGLLLVASGALLSVIFAAIAMLAVVFTRDKAKGIGTAVLMWLYFTVLFDGLVLFGLFQLSDYPIEKAMIIISSLNPIDLSRILILLKLDISALMGYTGAIFQDFFGTATGMTLSFVALMLWILIPVGISLHKFSKKDL
ncbi:MAG: ABC transporter permease subunit [Chitinophagales bacterium]|nr:ABC transporter permease subunit [Chitinophagales bacterium]